MGMRHGAQRLRLPGGLADAAAAAVDSRGWPSWIAVGTSATTAGMLLGDRRRQDVLRELRPRRLAAMGRAAGGRHRLADARAPMPRCRGGRCRRSSNCSGPRDGRRRIGADGVAGPGADRHHADRSRDRARLHLRSALPRFSVRLADHGGGAVRAPDAAQPAAGGRAPDRRIRLCRLAASSARSLSASTRAAQNWQSMWTCAIYLLLALTLWRARAVQIPK